MTENVDSALLVEVLKEVRQELRDHRALLLESLDQGRSLDRQVETALLVLGQRIAELKDDLELVIKSELMGLAGDFDGRGPGP